MMRSLLLFPLIALAQTQPPAPASAVPPPATLVSPEVHTDRTVTFRFRDPNAKQVRLSLEGSQRQDMTVDDKGVWSITTAPLEPDYYGYSFVADGVSLVDPSNTVIKPNLRGLSNMVHTRDLISPGKTPPCRTAKCIITSIIPIS